MERGPRSWLSARHNSHAPGATNSNRQAVEERKAAGPIGEQEHGVILQVWAAMSLHRSSPFRDGKPGLWHFPLSPDVHSQRDSGAQNERPSDLSHLSIPAH